MHVWFASCLISVVGAVEVRDPVAPLDREPCSKHHVSNPELARFCKWLVDDCQATKVDDVFVGQFSHNNLSVRGVGATRDISEGEKVICIPRRCWLARGLESDRVKRLTSKCDNRLATLAIHIAEEMSIGNQSFWAPYFTLLPKQSSYESFHPSYLKGHALHHEVSYWASWLRSLEKCYSIYKLAANGTAVKPESVILAFVIVMTRRYSTTDVVPLADMINAALPSAVNVLPAYEDGSAADNVCMESLRSIKKGEELLADYGAGDHSAMSFFSIYGFSFSPDDHNPDNHHMVIKGSYDIDGCAGLRPDELHEPAQDSNPILYNYWRFAQLHCRREEESVEKTSDEL
eukprot:TRINITY_DN31045_c0_g1_i1.p1 TRINITY_DN31045_c0_g1~~TRINITY_DN31045_c0_g1_i1.p1  ORF type:complete len:346 (-),score=34.31 TRINITY_DN31045_c0_g1_i1:112-1149(-)